MLNTVASEHALARYGIAPCMLVPVAAVDEMAIAAHVGEIRRVLSGRGRVAFLVHAYSPPPIDPRYAIWNEPGPEVLHRSLQFWVHVDYTRYRQAYVRAFPTEPLADMVLSHAINRRVAALKGFGFVRLSPTSRCASSSSAFSEQWGVTLHGSERQMAINRERGLLIQYADLSDLMLLMNQKVGGGLMDAVNAGQRLLRMT